MKRGFLLLFLVTICAWSIASDDVSSKLSISTQMFLDERNGELSLEPEKNALDRLDAKLDLVWRRPYMLNQQRMIARPSTVDGVQYISAFVRLNDNTDVSALEALGVEVQCRFDGGLITCEIPVDAIESVAALGNVRRVNVAQLMQKTTNAARQGTHVDDVLTRSADAQALGILSSYDGTGVILGVIDTGIDFQHIAFKDKNGNYRFNRAYIYNGSSDTEYSGSNLSNATTDDEEEEHGTHTSSTAGGSSVIISGSNVTVTDNHAQATYGGMAPGTELYLCGINSLSNTYLANSFQKICTYADQQGKPVVVSNSWGSSIGPHDGTGDFADITAQYFGDSHPGHICLFSSGNNAGAGSGSGSGYYATKSNVSSSNPFSTILYSHTYSNTSDGYYYSGICLNAWARSTSVSSLTLKVMVINASTGAVLKTVTVTPSSNGTSITGLSTYYDGTLYAYKDYISSNKTQVLLYTQELTSKSVTNNNSFYTSNYVLAVQLYPSSGSTTIDAWGGTYGYFGNTPANSTYNWVAGSDDCSVGDEATDPNVICVGAYVTKNRVTDYNGTTHDLSSTYTMGDIAYFSSYATAAACPTGQQLPWICAPGATIASAVNHLHTSGGYLDDTYADYGMYRVNSNTSYPYGTMEGTSMSTPVAAGIVALWLQAGLEAGKSMTTSYVKEVMQQTATRDSYVTTGANASHFGQGKINALAGIQYILGSSTEPRITATPTALTFTGKPGETLTQTVTVSGFEAGNVTASVDNALFTVTPATLSSAAVEAGATVTVTFRSTVEGTQTGTLTLTDGTLTATVSLSAEVHDTGSASDPYLDVQRYATIDEAGATVSGMSSIYKYAENNDGTAWLTLSTYGAYKAASNQAWITTSGTNTTSGSWTYNTAPFYSSSSFFTGTAYAMGKTGTGSSTVAVNFFVTNVTEVRALLRGYSQWNTKVNAYLYVYKCTENSNGTLTASSSTTGSQSTSSTSATSLTVSGLDASSIYKVTLQCTRGLLYEAAFKTTLPEDLTPTLAVNPASLTFSGLVGTPSTQTVTLSGDNLTDAVTVTTTGAGFSTDVTSITASQAAAGKAVAVTFTPTAAGTFNGTVTFSSPGAESVSVALTATITSNLRYKSTSDDTWHYLSPNADGVYALTDFYAFEVLDEVPNADISYTRKFKNTNMQSICLPFDVAITSEFLQNFAVDEIFDNYAKDTDGDGEIDLIQILTESLKEGDVMHANYPYLIKASAAQEMTIASSGVTIYPTSPVIIDCSSTRATYTFCGTYTQMSVEELSGYYVTSAGSLSHSSTPMNPFRWYMAVSGRNGYQVSELSQVVVMRNGDTTRIDELESDDIEQPAYDLMGRQVLNPTGGIYIINGKKVLVK